ncbi:MAG: TraB/GumN family protein [Spirochaetaceae bacterium]|jgi:pheromone shutdown-related protein TraB|nr:TraB/GumN family protein [Spirochaetaceae bacterium]
MQITIDAAGRQIVLIGTAHVSRESIDEVAVFIHEEQPNMVCIELDRARYDAMTGSDAWQKLDMIKVFREGKGFLLVANLVLSSFQRRLGTALGVRPGDEMLSALTAAQELNIPYSFCDREVQVTLRRAWAQCGFWSKCKLLSVLLSSALSSEKLSEEEVENLKQNSELDGMMRELSVFLPAVKTVVIDERDYYLAAKIWENSAGKSKTVAVVGAGHLNGIQAHLDAFSQHNDESPHSLDALEAVPPPGLFSKISAWVIPALIALFVVAGILSADITIVRDSLIRWLLWNGSLAAVGAVMALAHPLAVIAAFIGAPVGTLSPFISVGLFSGIAQAYLCRPRIKDAESLIDDAATVKGIYRNRILHILLVFFLSSIGGIAGNIISFASFAQIFAGFFSR